MKTKILLIGFILICMVSHAAAFAGGSGTFADPYQIEDVTDLQNMKNSVSSHYILVDDIDASITSTWNSGAGFEPVGTTGVKFSGSLRGNGYDISDLTINRPTTNGIGIFGYTEYAYLDNITLINADITGQIFVGGIMGYSDGAIVTASHVNGTIEGTNYAVGGIAGHTGDYGTIETSSSDALVIGAGDYTGGLVGLLDSDSSILRSWSYGEVDGTRYTGGLVGYMNTGEIRRSFSQADVNGTQHIGGLVGYVASSPFIEETYAAGAITGSSNTGGLIGGKDVTTPSVSTSYWDTQTTGQATSIAGTGKTTAQMLTQSTYAFWDFNNNWKMLPYPVLDPGNEFYVSPFAATINRDAPPTIHSVDFDFYRKGAASYGILIATDDSYLQEKYSFNSLAPYPMVNLTRSLSFEAGTYYMKITAKDSNGNTFDTVETTFNIVQSFNLNSTSVAGVVSKVTSGALTAIPYVNVQIYNDTWSDTYNTGTNGYYQFTNLAPNSTYYLRAAKNGYDDGNINPVSTLDGVTINRNLFLLETTAPNYITPHYVEFIVRSFNEKYQGVLVTVYEGNRASPLSTKYTGSNGAVGFELSETTQYRLTFYKEGVINREVTITPVRNSYTVWVDINAIIDSMFNNSDQQITNVNIGVTTSEINDTHAIISVSYDDAMGETTGLSFTLQQSVKNQPGNYSIIATTSPGDVDQANYNFTVSNYKGGSYIVSIEAQHDTFGSIAKQYGVTFEGDNSVFGFAVEILIWLVVVGIVWFASSASQADVYQTGFALCGLTAVFKIIGLTGSFISWPAIALALTICIVGILYQGEKEAV